MTQGLYIMRNDGGGVGGYVFSALTLMFSMLTPQDIIIGFGALGSLFLGILTYISNDRRNKRIAAAEEQRNEIIRRYFAKHEGDPPARDRETLDAIQDADL